MYRVVLVEDSKLLRTGMKYTLDWDSLDCEIAGDAENGQEGLELIRRTRPDIVITDIRMPGLDGLEMIERLHAEQNGAVFIIISAYHEFTYAQRAVRYGVADYMVKPFTDEEIMETMRSACTRVEANRQDALLRWRLETVEKSKIITFESYLSSEEGKVKREYTQRAIQYIKDHYAENINVHLIANALNVSESHLSKVFKETMHHTIGEYLMQYRIKEACRLLQNFSYRICEVSEQVGYTDQRYFSVAFKRIMGVTPGGFRDGGMPNHLAGLPGEIIKIQEKKE
jgi:two-component system response regulator YesN